MRLFIFNSFSWNNPCGHIIYLWLVIRLYPNVEPSKVLMAIINLWFKSPSWSLLLLESAKFTFDMTSLSQQDSSWKDPARVEFTFTRRFSHASEAAFTMCRNPNKVISRGNSPQPTFHFTRPAWLCNLSRLILKKGGFTPVLANNKIGIFTLKRAFLGESQRPVGRLSDQISSFRLEKHWEFLTYLQLTNMLHYRIHGFLCSLLERAAMKTKDFANIWKAAFANIWKIFCPPPLLLNYGFHD